MPPCLSLVPLLSQDNTMRAKIADSGLPLEHVTLQRLQEEKAALKAELQALRSITQHEASQSTARTGQGQTFGFFRLPRELRDVIYKLCVVVGKVLLARPVRLYPVDMRYQCPRGAAAVVSLFAVNHLVRREALELYLSKNHFVITLADLELLVAYRPPFSQIPGHLDSEVFVNLRSISVSLDNRDSMQLAHRTFGEATDFHLVPDSPEEVETFSRFHQNSSVELYYELQWTLSSVFGSNTQLRDIQINVQEYCLWFGVSSNGRIALQ
jgi:hypothetical protein